MARVARVVKISAQELDRVKQNRNGMVGIPRKRLEEKAEALADQGEWTSFIDILALLMFGIVLFPNVDGLVHLAAIDAFLAYHHSKESPVVAVATTSTAAEADPTHPSGVNQTSRPALDMVGQGGEVLGSTGGPHMVQCTNSFPPYG